VVLAALFILRVVNYKKDILEEVLLFGYISSESSSLLFLFVLSTTDGGKF